MKQWLPLLKKLHLWTGLSCGLIASFSGITGALYVWQPEMSAALNPEILTVADFNSVMEDEIHATALQLTKKHLDSISVLNLPYREQQTISLVFDSGKTLFYHPGSGNRLGGRSSSMIFFENLLKIHRTLGITDYGKYIVGGGAVLFFALLLSSGFYVWWGRYGKKIKRGFTIKTGARAKRFNYDLHKVVGIVFMIPLAIMAMSGAYFTYHPQYKKVFGLADALVPRIEQSDFVSNAQTVPLLERIAKPDMHYALRAVMFPENTRSGIRLRYVGKRGVGTGLRRVKELTIDRAGQPLSVAQFHTDMPSDKLLAQMYPIHTGEIIGIFGRLLVFIAGWVPTFLLITGIRFYYFRKRDNVLK